MKPSIASFESEELIDVSKDAKTPANSSSPLKGPVIPETQSGCIEDLYSETTKAEASAGRAPDFLENADDLYGLSPRAAIASETAKVVGKRSSTTGIAAHVNPQPGNRQHNAPGSPSRRPTGPADPLNDLLSKGAISRPPTVGDSGERLTSQQGKY